jgi:hypothetical protein
MVSKQSEAAANPRTFYSVKQTKIKLMGGNDEIVCHVLPYIFLSFLGAFADLQQGIIKFFMSTRPHGTTRLALDGF